MDTLYKVVGYGSTTLLTEDDLIEHVMRYRYSDGYEHTYFQKVSGRFLFWKYERWLEVDPILVMIACLGKER